MDSQQQQQKGGRRLTKRREHAPPPVAYLNSSNNNNNNTSTLKRSPSDASYFNQQPQAQHHHYQYQQQQQQQQQQGGLGLGISQRGPSSSTTTASPLLRRSPSLLTPVHEQLHPAGGHYTAQAASFAHLPPASVGAPFNATIVEEALYASRGSSSSGAAGTRRPSPPQHSYTYSPDHHQPAKLKAPTLRQSASFTALARKMDTPPSGTKSPRSNRYSDEGDSAKKRLSGGGKKKGAFSSFMSNLVSSPRRPTISTPTNPMHVTHVSIDNETGEYTVRGPLAC
jgi:p21-activated kinase 1